jgi:Cu/Ag efflux pump CusA
LKPGLSGDEVAATQADVRRVFAGFAGVNASVMTFLMERIEETLSGYTASVVVNVFGNDLDVLDQTAQQIARVIAGIRGANDVAVQSPPACAATTACASQISNAGALTPSMCGIDLQRLSG